MSKSASVDQSAAAEKFRVKRSFTDEFKQSAVRLVVAEGYSFAAAATAVNVSEQSLRHWHARFAPKPPPCGEDATLDELRGEQAAAPRTAAGRDGARDLKKSHGVFREGVAVKYAWIQPHRDSFPVAVICHVLAVSPGGYYALWTASRARGPSVTRAFKRRCRECMPSRTAFTAA